MRYLAVVLVSVFFAGVVAAGLSTIDPPVAEAAGGGYAPKCGGGRIFLKADEKATFKKHNDIRRNHNLKPFCVHPALEKAARAHSKDMIQRDYFSHYTKGRNENACERIRRYGYHWRYCGENIAYGSGSLGQPGSKMRKWMKSSEHRHNILNPRFREIGVGTTTGTFQGTRGVTMYTADFGTRS